MRLFARSDTKQAGAPPLRTTPPSEHQAATIRRLIKAYQDVGGNYHVLHVSPGLTIPGLYDVSRVIHHYELPADLTGRTVLDVGTSTGYLAFECARRGADVTAIDLWPGDTFNHLLELLGLKARYVRMSLYDLAPSFGQFDYVLCGSLLVHLRDIFGAVQKLREVCRGEAVVCTNDFPDPQCQHRALLEFLGYRAPTGDGGEYWAYWNVNAQGLARLLQAAGFATVSAPRRFQLRTEPGGTEQHDIPHVVVHARL